MSAYRQAMLSVAPERVEQFSLAMKQTINDKNTKESSSRAGGHGDGKIRSKKRKRSSEKSRKSKNSSKTQSSRSKRKSKKDAENTNKKIRKVASDEELLTEESDMEKDGLDLKKELYPLAHYVKDRRLLMDTMFSIVKGTKLSAMLPDILKNISEEEIKQRCYSHLEVMSSKRINYILAGEIMQSSSGTDSDADGDKHNEAIPKVSKSKRLAGSMKEDSNSLQANFVDSTTSSGCEVLSLLAGSSEEKQSKSQPQEIHSTSRTADSESAVGQDVKVRKKKKLDENLRCWSSESSEYNFEIEQKEELEEEVETVEYVENEEYQDMVDSILEETLPPPDDPQKEELQIKSSTAEGIEQSKVADTHPSLSDNTVGLSKLQLLELQLRARAIKSLMKSAQGTKKS